MKEFLKECIISLIISIILIFILSILVSLTSVSENIIKPTTIGITTFSILVGSFRLSKNKKEKGIIYGGLLGIIYIVTMYLISSIYNFDFSLNIYSIIMIILAIIGGCVGGILGVNL